MLNRLSAKQQWITVGAIFALMAILMVHVEGWLIGMALWAVFVIQSLAFPLLSTRALAYLMLGIVFFGGIAIILFSESVVK